MANDRELARKTFARPFLAFAAALALGHAAAAPITAPAVVIGPKASDLERFAAGELCSSLGKLFGLEVQPAAAIPGSARQIFLIGDPASNPLIPKRSFPAVTDQGRSEE